MIFLALSLLTGVLYPLLVTVIAQGLFPRQATGSLLFQDGKPCGSTLVGQPFSDPKYFWGRPSATSSFPYNASASSGSNIGPTNGILRQQVLERIEVFHKFDLANRSPLPVDLVTSSASGLDPHISIAGAKYQVHRIARLRDIPEDQLVELVDKHKQDRFLGVIGEPVVNVLALNMELDQLDKK